MTRQRRQRGEGSFYKRRDGMWVGAVTLGYDQRGTLVRKTVSSKSKAVALRKFNDLKRAVADTGTAPSRVLTVDAYLTQWLGNVRVKPGTLKGYRSAVTLYITPAVGRRRLADLRPQHVRDMLRTLETRGSRRGGLLSPATVNRAHRVLRAALNDAVADQLIPRNVAEHVTPPSLRGREQEALTADQAKTLLRSLPAGDPLAARWALAILMGLRQGETLGLEWSRIDTVNGTVDLSWQLQRLPWRHGVGCGPVWSCGRKRPGSCPNRILDVRPDFEYRPVWGALALTRPKSQAGWRIIPLPPFVLRALYAHHERHGTTLDGLVFARDDGRPIDPSDDSAAWHAALDAAGLPPVKLHAARHTTATLLLELGVDPRVIQAILGHSTAAMTRAYQHVGLDLARQAMGAMGDLFEIED